MGKKGKNNSNKRQIWQYNEESENISNNESLFENKFTYLCAGTFLVSIHFIKNIINTNTPNSIWVLLASWVILVLALLINMWSIFYTNSQSKKLQKDMEDNWDN